MCVPTYSLIFPGKITDKEHATSPLGLRRMRHGRAHMQANHGSSTRTFRCLSCRKTSHLTPSCAATLMVTPDCTVLLYVCPATSTGYMLLSCYTPSPPHPVLDRLQDPTVLTLRVGVADYSCFVLILDSNEPNI